MSTDTSERGLERRICTALTGSSCDAASTQQGPNDKAAVPLGSEGWACGHAGDYDHQYTVGPNRFSGTRQLRYGPDQTQRALDLCLFINGLPIATSALKNSLTKQTAADAVEQYKRDRDSREQVFQFGRCVVHFAVED
jgi:hypothetical protein